MLIGLTGKNAAGKGEVAKLLRESGYEYHSLSDILREELTKRKQQVTRENLIQIGNQLRTEYGAGVLAEKTLQKLTPGNSAAVDSIRNPFEVEVLRRRDDFFLIAVDADPKIRFERLKNRAREGDPTTYDLFLELEAREAQSSDATTQQLNRTIDMADAGILNDGTLEMLGDKVREVIQGLAASRARPDWDHYFMNIARVVALRSNCIKRKVAAVVVKDHRLVSTGYNGTPRGIRNCNEGGCPRCNQLGKSGANLDECVCSHAEENAIVQAAYHGTTLKGATLYCLISPCLTCTKMIINSGIREVVYTSEYTISETPLRLLKEAGITVRVLEKPLKRKER